MIEAILSSISLFWPEITLALTFVVAMILEFSLKNGGRTIGIVVLIGIAGMGLGQADFAVSKPIAVRTTTSLVSPGRFNDPFLRITNVVLDSPRVLAAPVDLE